MVATSILEDKNANFSYQVEGEAVAECSMGLPSEYLTNENRLEILKKDFYQLYNVAYIMLLQVSDCESFHSYKRDWISGESRCETPQCWVQGQCLGQTLDLDIVANEDACLAWCESKSGCNWFTFFKPAAECILFRTCPTIDDTCSDCISGESSCAPHFGPSGIPLASALEIKISRIRLFVRNLEN